METKPGIYCIDLHELRAAIESWGAPAYRADQIWVALYRQFRGAPEEIHTLPRALQARLESAFRFRELTPIQNLISKDGQTHKTIFRLPSGEAIETVLMRYKKRLTLCISSQAGCAMGCVFCATGQMGLRTNLTSGQIVEQVVFFAELLKQVDERPTNVVLMGMGEPFHNYEATMQAIDRLNHPEGYNFGARRFTVSTVGLVPMIERFTRERRQVNLAVSLHAADNELRTSLVPINKRYPLETLITACRRYVAHTGRRITFEWALIRDVNDSPEQARRLANLVKDLLCHVNVIPLNPTRDYPGMATPIERARDFQNELQRHNIPCTIRIRRGIDIQAGCGQLATDIENAYPHNTHEKQS